MKNLLRYLAIGCIINFAGATLTLIAKPKRVRVDQTQKDIELFERKLEKEKDPEKRQKIQERLNMLYKRSIDLEQGNTDPLTLIRERSKANKKNQKISKTRVTPKNP